MTLWMMPRTVGGSAGGWLLSAGSGSLISSSTAIGTTMLTNSGIGPFPKDMSLSDVFGCVGGGLCHNTHMLFC